ncbi:prepilin-type N-terminal cleavage/methylation domain-containing protein [Pelomonas sp. SE-A7]|uniref:type IV pilus modification PilV family protein n=1 Tax=Pelomonas sp. SE-A7 TaxID=3054953 RepID=UPI00259CFB9C|nr:prepilin-type N-terminal cleavage/methylation domain-containing protein [Pelomonas sp. SE-A7]MDM4767790.1 prepilin-type N-terminal cleavage/methylation domain-containing protein [Pelomonas sp. SE-A7]
MWNRQQRSLAQRGFTLPEALLVIVVLGLGLAGIMKAYSTVAAGSADPVVQKQLLSIAEELMEEVQLRPYAVAGNVAPTGCARNTFNDVRDYDGYATTGQVCSIDGSPIGQAGVVYTISISVQPTTLAGVASALQITVTVSQSGQTLSLVGYRTDYAGP